MRIVRKAVEDWGLKEGAEPDLWWGTDWQEIRDELEFQLAVGVQAIEGKEITIVVGVW